jgi:uncharacterized protein YjbI with pentapeptide repeats
MANIELVKILKQGVAEWNQWRGKNSRMFPDLVGADLRGANLIGANLGGVNLTGGDLTSANLASATLIDANLSAADLRWANVSGTNLGGADLSGAYVFNSDFTNSLVGFTVFGNNDLSTAKGLETVRHLGPSTIGVDTIYKSKGNIPEAFLRGAGLPDDFIAQMKSIVNKPLAFHSCFISYSSQDDEFTQRLYADLQQQGVRCWLAPKDLRIGDKFRMRIDESIRIHDKLMVILSANSIRSPWVEEEVAAALEKERNRKTSVLVSIRLDDAVMETDQAWAASLRRARLIGDFHAWHDQDSYQKSFEELLRHLKA